MVFPRASTFCAPPGIFTRDLGPASTMRPFSITTTESGTGSRPVPSISVPPTSAIFSARLPEMPLEISARAAIPSEPASPTNVQTALIAFANRFEVVEFGVGGDGRDKIAVRIKPKRFAAPDQSFDGEAIEFLLLAINSDSVCAARLDLHLAFGKCGELRRRAMRRPVPHHEHLHGGGRVARDGKKLRRASGFGPFVAVAQADFFGLHFDGLVNVRLAGILAFDFEGVRSPVISGTKCSRERHGSTAVGELEINFCVQCIAVTRDLVGFFTDGLLELVQDEFSLFGRSGRLRENRLHKRSRKGQREKKCK